MKQKRPDQNAVAVDDSERDFRVAAEPAVNLGRPCNDGLIVAGDKVQSTPPGS